MALRGSEDVSEDLQEMKEERRRRQPPLGVLQLLRSPEHRPAVGVAVIMHLSQQLSGINAVSHQRSPRGHERDRLVAAYVTSCSTLTAPSPGT